MGLPAAGCSSAVRGRSKVMLGRQLYSDLGQKRIGNILSEWVLLLRAEELGVTGSVCAQQGVVLHIARAHLQRLPLVCKYTKGSEATMHIC